MHLQSILLFFALATCVLGTSPFSLRNELIEKILPFAKRAPQSVCYKYACEGGSGKCGLYDDTQTICTNNHRFCETDDSGMGTCTKFFADGQTCEFSDECESAYCLEGVCKEAPVAPRQNGESCSASSECGSNICTSKICQNIASGDSCTSDAQCAADYYCAVQSAVLSVCTKRGAMGENCYYSDGKRCLRGYVCGAEAKCIIPFTTESGGRCVDSTECAEGTTCIPSNNGTYTCTAAESSSGSSCSSNNDCARIDETCTCNANTGAQTCATEYMNTLKGLAGAARDLSDCLVDKCKGNTYGTACTENACKKQSCKYRSTFASGLVELYKDWCPKCYLDFLSREAQGALCGSASTVALSVAAVAAAVVVYLF